MTAAHGPFIERVQALRASWQERREVLGIAGSHEYDPQLGLLLTIYRWTSEAAAQVSAVYGSDLDLTLSPAPRAGESPTFQLVLADSFVLRFALHERRRIGNPRWHISATMAAGAEAGVTAVGPERRNGQWTRARVEDILLSLLGAYERTLADRPRKSPRRRATPA